MKKIYQIWLNLYYTHNNQKAMHQYNTHNMTMISELRLELFRIICVLKMLSYTNYPERLFRV